MFWKIRPSNYKWGDVLGNDNITYIIPFLLSTTMALIIKDTWVESEWTEMLLGREEELQDQWS